MRKAGRFVHPDDSPPGLGWEYGIWWLYLRVQTQWRTGTMGVRTGLDYNPAIAFIKHMEWDLALSLMLLQAVELVALNPGEASDTPGD